MGYTINQNDSLEIVYLDENNEPQSEFFSGIVNSLDYAKEFVRGQHNSISSVTYFIEILISNNDTPYASQPGTRFGEYRFPTIEAFLITREEWVINKRYEADAEVQQYLDSKFIPSDD